MQPGLAHVHRGIEAHIANPWSSPRCPPHNHIQGVNNFVQTMTDFNNPTRVIDTAPFHVSELGWGEFVPVISSVSGGTRPLEWCHLFARMCNVPVVRVEVKGHSGQVSLSNSEVQTQDTCPRCFRDRALCMLAHERRGI
jgi:hypothetical protein